VKIAIIGGGIGGLTTALALRKFGFEPEVFEQAPQLLEVGSAIAMWPNALRVLLKLGIGEKVIGNAGWIERVRWCKYDGRPLNEARLPINDVPAVALHRADLQSALLHALPESSIQLGRTFADYQEKGIQIQVRFTDHSSIDCDFLIGADGLHSHVREQFTGDGPPVYRGYTVWRGMTDHTPAELTPGTAVEIHGYGQRFGIGPVGRGRLGWWASANEQEYKGIASAGEQQELLKLFDGWWSPVLQLIEATPAATILRNPALDRPSSRRWGVGRMTLLGDAIHPTTPNLGQGGCMAVEDAAVLARCFEKYADASEGLRTYERLRSSRTATLASYSRLYGRVGQWENQLGVVTRGLLISALPERLMQRVLRLIFDYDAYAVRIS